MNDSPAETPFILIVEDNDDDYDAMTRAFEEVPLENALLRCKSGREAMAYLRRENDAEAARTEDRPGLILLDLNMHGMDGRKVLQLIKEDEKLKGIPVVIVTTSGNEQDILSCYKLGANAYVRKPDSFEELVELAKQCKGFWLKTASMPKI
jgi:two-component system, response regulator